MKKESGKKRITVIEYLGLLPSEKRKWKPVYFNGKDFDKDELIGYESYINIPRKVER